MSMLSLQCQVVNDDHSFNARIGAEFDVIT